MLVRMLGSCVDLNVGSLCWPECWVCVLTGMLGLCVGLNVGSVCWPECRVCVLA